MPFSLCLAPPPKKKKTLTVPFPAPPDATASPPDATAPPPPPAQSKYKQVKLTCRQRSELLSTLHAALTALADRAAARGAAPCQLAQRFLGPELLLRAAELRGGGSVSRSTASSSLLGSEQREEEWLPCLLRVSGRGIEALDPASRRPRWGLEWRHAGSPAIVLLARSSSSPSGDPFALVARGARAARVFALTDPGADASLQLARAARAAAAERGGLELAVDASRAATAGEFVAALAAAGRERESAAAAAAAAVAAAGTGAAASAAAAAAAPLGEWRVNRVFPSPAAAPAAPPTPGGGGPPPASSPASASAPSSRRKARLLTLTADGTLLERSADTYDVIDARPLSALAAAAAPTGEPSACALEWSDGAPRWELDDVSPDRDGFLSCLAAAAVASAPASTAPPPGSPSRAPRRGPLHIPPRRTSPLDVGLMRAAAAADGIGGGGAAAASAADAADAVAGALELEAAVTSHLAQAARAALAEASASSFSSSGGADRGDGSVFASGLGGVFTDVAPSYPAPVFGALGEGEGASASDPSPSSPSRQQGPVSSSSSPPPLDARARLARRAATFCAVVPLSGPRSASLGGSGILAGVGAAAASAAGTGALAAPSSAAGVAAAAAAAAASHHHAHHHAHYQRADEPTLFALLALLPPPPPPAALSRGARASRGALTPDDAADAVVALQALQRLCAAPPGASAAAAASSYSQSSAAALLAMTPAAPRIFACLDCGAPHAAAEAARLLVRLWAPHAASAGLTPWDAPWRQGGGGAAGSSSAAAAGDDGAAAASAKAICLGAPGRAAALVNVLRGSPTVVGEGGGEGPSSSSPSAALARTPPSALAAAAVVDALAAAVAPPGSRSTGARARRALLMELGNAGPALFALFGHADARVHEGAALLTRAVVAAAAAAGTGSGSGGNTGSDNGGSAAAAAAMRDAALEEGALLHHFSRAVAPESLRGVLLQEAASSIEASSSSSSGQGGGLVGRSSLSRSSSYSSFSSSFSSSGGLSMDLVALWADGHPPALDLLRRCLPPGLARHLDPLALRPSVGPLPQVVSAAAVPSRLPAAAAVTGAVVPPQQRQVPSAAPTAATPSPAALAQQQQQQAGAAARPPLVPSGAAATTATATTTAPPLASSSTLVRTPSSTALVSSSSSSSSLASLADWRSLWRDLARDHAHAGLVWNERTRAELRDALAAEAAALRRGKAAAAGGASFAPSASASAAGGGGGLLWNHWEFSVPYPSLASEPCAGGVYVRLLLDGADRTALLRVPRPRELFHALWSALLAAGDEGVAVAAKGWRGGGGRSRRQQGGEGEDDADGDDAFVNFGGGDGEVDPSSSSPPPDRVLLTRAAAAVYDAHAAVVGSFTGAAHVAALADGSPCARLRSAALRLLSALLAPTAATTSAAALAATARARADFLAAGGVRLLVDVAAQAHADRLSAGLEGAAPAAGAGAVAAAAAKAKAGESSDGRQQQQPSSLLLTATAHEPAKMEWYCSDASAAARATAAIGGGGGGARGEEARFSASSPSRVAPDGTPLFGPLPRAGALRAAALCSSSSSCSSPPSSPLLLWAPGMRRPLPVDAIRQLRWARDSARAPLGGRRADAEAALRCLLRLATSPLGADARAAAGALGARAIFPAPKVLRALAAPECLPHLAQVLLTGDPALVALSAALLERVATAGASGGGVGGGGASSGSSATAAIADDAVLRGLFRTGAPYFALCYGGSNLAEVGSLLAATHLDQDWPPGAPRRQRLRSGAGSPRAQVVMPSDSFLSGVLPPGLLHVLSRRGGGAFAAALAGDTDDPELVWTSGMRATRLLPQLRAHVGDLPARLRDNAAALYEFLPCPPLEYPELARELWCHRYCLRNLCDEARFPGWPIGDGSAADAVAFGRALLEEWRRELARTPAGLSAGDALRELGLSAEADAFEGKEKEQEQEGDGRGRKGVLPPGEALRAAYRAAARKYHPDRNPAGRDRFQAAAAAYERLTSGPGGEGGSGGEGGNGSSLPPQSGADPDDSGGATRRWRLLLLLRAQRLLFSRSGGVLSPYRYAGFLPLLRTVARRLAGLPDGDVEASAALERLSRERKEAPSRASDESDGSGQGPDRLLLSLALSEGGDGDDSNRRLPPREHFLSASSAPLLLAAADLAAATASASPENNGAELARCGGVGVCSAALSRAAATLTSASATDFAPAAQLSACCLRALEAMASSGDAAAVGALEAVAGGGAGEEAAATAAGERASSLSFHLASDVVHVASFRGAPAAAAAAVDAIAALSRSSRLQDALLSAGAVQALVPLLFGFDPTLGDEERAASAAAGRAEGGMAQHSGQPQQQQRQMLLQSGAAATAALPAPSVGGDSSSSALISAPAQHQQQHQPLAAPVSLPQLAPRATASSSSSSSAAAAASPHRSATAERNDLALRAARAVAALAGVGGSSESPPNAAARAALAALLTPPLARRLAAADHVPLLSDLAGAVRSPAAVWDASMRSLLLAALDEAGEKRSSVAELACFRYPSLEGELVVSGVYVRAYCSEPGFPLADGTAFVKGLVSHVHDFVVREGGEGPPAPASAAPPDDDDAARDKGRLTARRHLAESLRALRLALEACPRAAAAMASRPALAPLLAIVERGTPRPATKGGEERGEEQGREQQQQQQQYGDGDAAALALAALVRLTAHAGCVAALSERRALRAAFFAAHRPPTPTSRALALRLLSPLVGAGGGAAGGGGEGGGGGGGSAGAASGGSVAGAEAAWEACASGGAMCLLSVVLPKRSTAAVPSRSSPSPGDDDDASAGDPTPDERAAAAALLGRLASHPSHGGRVALLLRRLLPPGAVAVLLDGPGDVAADALRRDADTPEHVWSAAMASAAAADADAWALSAAAVAHSSSAADSPSSEWTPPPPPSSQSSPLGADGLGASLLREPYVGGVYVRRFLRSPGARLRDPAAFLQGLLDAFARAARGAVAASRAAAAASAGGGSPPREEDDARFSALVAEAALMSAAACELLGGRPALRERAASLGVVRTCLSVLAERLPAAVAALPRLAALARASAAASPSTSPPPPPSDEDGLGGCALRLLHASLAGCAGAADALAAEPPAALAPLVAPAGLGAAGGAWGVAAEVLAAEALTRALEAASRGRASLVASACAAGAVPALLARLEPGSSSSGSGSSVALVPSGGNGNGGGGGDGSGGEASRDACVARVAAISCLRALSECPAGGQPAAAAAAALERSAAWRTNAGARHDLYLPSGAEAGPGGGRGGSLGGEGVARLLSGNSGAAGGARFALPAPEAIVAPPVVVARAPSPPPPPPPVVVARAPSPLPPPVAQREPSPPPALAPPVGQRGPLPPPPSPPPPVVEREPSPPPPPPPPQLEATPEAEEEVAAVAAAEGEQGRGEEEETISDDGLDPLGAAPPTPVPADRDPLQD